MHDTDACKCCLHKETLCNNGRYEAWFDHFKLTITVVYGLKHKVWYRFSYLEQAEHFETNLSR